jgi:hypothetical protein
MLIKPFSWFFWVVLMLGLGLALLPLSLLDYREARAIKIIRGLVIGSFLFWLKGRSQGQ